MSDQKTEYKSSYSDVIAKYNEVASKYATILQSNEIMMAFERAGFGLQNMTPIQSARVKAINTLPADYTKENVGEFLRSPYENEKELRQTAQILRWTAYPFFKITKAYADIPTYRYFTKPLYVDEARAKSDAFRRENILLDKLNKKLRPDVCAHKITSQAITNGKVFYTIRTNVDKVHNKVNYAFMQQLPQDYCYIIGYNNISGYTVSFDMMYFMQPGTDPLQFGDLFLPYIDGFNRIFEPPKTKEKVVYASAPKIDCKGRKLSFYPENVIKGGEGNPRMFMQNGRWCYYVSLPVDKVWTFEIDDSTTAAASPLSGLMLTYSQQSDYEAAQLSLILNPLIKIFTGEIPYFKDEGSMIEDKYKLSIGGRALFEHYFEILMASTNTGGTAFFSAPVENIKSHDFNESANANEISESFNRYAGEKSGLAALIPVAEDVKAGQVEKSALLESRFSTATIYAQFERMMRSVYDSLNLTGDYDFVMFGTIYNESTIRADAEKALAEGDLSQRYILAALDGMSLTDKYSLSVTVHESGILDYLIPPVTAYTQSGGEEGGRPSKTVDDVGKGEASESLEDSIDTRGQA